MSKNQPKSKREFRDGISKKVKPKKSFSGSLNKKKRPKSHAIESSRLAHHANQQLSQKKKITIHPKIVPAKRVN